MYKYLAISLVLLASCMNEVIGDLYRVDYDDARRATVTAWEDVVGKVSDKCYYYLKTVIVMEVDKMSDLCVADEGERVIGCNIGNQIHILASKDDYSKADIAVHEYIHVLALCEELDPDPTHSDSRYWIEYGPDTVEAHGCANLTH